MNDLLCLFPNFSLTTSSSQSYLLYFIFIYVLFTYLNIFICMGVYVNMQELRGELSNKGEWNGFAKEWIVDWWLGGEW